MSFIGGMTLGMSSAAATVIEIDNFAAGPNANRNGVSTLTMGFAVGNHADRLLVVTIGGEFGSATTAVSYGTQPMVKAADAIAGGGTAASIWYLLSPDVGTAIISATIEPINGWTLAAASFYNVAQQVPTDIKTSTPEGATTSIITVDVVPAGGLIVEAAASNFLSSPIVPDSGQTSFQNVNTSISGGWSVSATYDFALAGSPSSQQVTIPSTQRLAHTAVSFAPVPEPGSVALLVAGAIGLWARRKRGRCRPHSVRPLARHRHPDAPLSRTPAGEK